VNKLRELRESKGLSLREAERQTAIQRSTLSRLERGKTSLSWNVARKLAVLYSVTLDEIMQRSLNNGTG
jgi:transcriptional regulator with XRE-family HTH domain